MRKLFLFWVLWSAVWILSVELLMGFGLCQYYSVGFLLLQAVVSVIASVIIVKYTLLRYLVMIILVMALIFSFSAVMLVSFILNIALLAVTFRILH